MNLPDTVPGAPPLPRWLRLNPLASGAIAGIVLLLSTGSVLLNFHLTRSQDAEDGMNNALRRAAAAAAAAVDPERHAKLTSPEQENSPDYLEQTSRLAAVLRDVSGPETFKFVYTCVLRDGKVRFVLDPTPAGDADGDGVDDKAHVWQEYPEAAPELLHTLRAGQMTVTIEPRTDRWGTFLSGFAPVRDAQGRTVACAGVDMELSAHRAALASIRRSTLFSAAGAGALALLAAGAVRSYHLRLRATIRSLVAATETAQAADRAKSRFLATMSHEFRTPLNGVLGMAELLRHTPLTPVQTDYLDTIHESGESLLAVMNDILDYSRIEAGTLTLNLVPVEPAALLRELTARHEPLAGARGLRFTATAAPGLPAHLLADRARLHQILDHLLANAVKFTPAGEVTLVAEPARLRDGLPAVRFSVRDTGVGISPEQREHLFKPFSQGDSSAARRFGGTGLGLVISRRLAEAMGGSVSVDSEPGRGTTIQVVLPAGLPPRTAAAGAAAAPAPAPQRQPGVVLVVSGDNLLRTLLVRLLAKAGATAEALPGAETLDERLRCGGVGLVLLDLALAEGAPPAWAAGWARRLPHGVRLAVINAGLDEAGLQSVRAAGAAAVLRRDPRLADLRELPGLPSPPAPSPA
jgi:signal transduction histidine kinase